ncbi:hypothetical protein R2F61_09225 [Mollicutes bacterium LVI A0078]|nr:hypothetical protein RZE84_09000 [Mollicutes bacterium LVI A0075]WOO90879.1 hypothetical protein R2F61_09225 [Mollicutes bacterium LVI A0078]
MMTKAGVIFKVQFNHPGTWNSKYYEYVDDDKKSLKEAKNIENTLDYFDYLDGNFENIKYETIKLMIIKNLIIVLYLFQERLMMLFLLMTNY